MEKTFEKVQIFDGGMGSSLEERGVSFNCVEDLNITHEDVIRDIHLGYKNADYITTNTFGLNKFKYKGNYSLKEVALKANETVELATNSLKEFSVSYTSDNECVTVDENGKVTAVKAGTATITAKIGSLYTRTCAVIVEKPIVTALRLPIREPQKMLADGVRSVENPPQVQNA